MSHERLAQLMQACREAMEADAVRRSTHETILSIFAALDRDEVTEGQALRYLGFQAARLADEPSRATLYRKAAADSRQMRA